jgi:hypothetical protein
MIFAAVNGIVGFWIERLPNSVLNIISSSQRQNNRDSQEHHANRSQCRPRADHPTPSNEHNNTAYADQIYR